MDRNRLSQEHRAGSFSKSGKTPLQAPCLPNCCRPFRSGYLPGTTRSSQRCGDCLAARTARSFTLAPAKMSTEFYSGHTPPLRHLKHLVDLFQAPATRPAAIAAPALVMLFILRVSWLRGCDPSAPVGCMSDRQVGIVSAEVFHPAISGNKTQKLSLTQQPRSSRRHAPFLPIGSA